MQFIKGGFALSRQDDLNCSGEIWQKGYNERRIKDPGEYARS